MIISSYQNWVLEFEFGNENLCSRDGMNYTVVTYIWTKSALRQQRSVSQLLLHPTKA